MAIVIFTDGTFSLLHISSAAFAEAWGMLYQHRVENGTCGTLVKRPGSDAQPNARLSSNDSAGNIMSRRNNNYRVRMGQRDWTYHGHSHDSGNIYTVAGPMA